MDRKAVPLRTEARLFEERLASRSDDGEGFPAEADEECTYEIRT